MKTFKKVLALLLVVALTATAAVSMTLAYLQDDDEAVNTMTLGNVDIEQIEQERNEGGLLVDFKQDKPLYPAVGELVKDGDYWTANNVVDKIVSVENTSKSSAYVRTIFAFEIVEGVDLVNKNINETDWTWEKDVAEITIDGATYTIWVATHPAPLASGATTAPSLYQVALDKTADNDYVNALGEYKILVVSQAIQSEGFENVGANAALNEGFGGISATNHPWVNGIIGDRWDGTSDPEGLVPSETDPNVYEIYTPAQLKAFADSVNGTAASTFSLRAASTGNSYAGYTVKLMADIDLNNVEWTPIGDCNGATYFQGTFDGQGYTISNLKIDNADETDMNSTAGLFGWIDKDGATIKNVKIDNATVKGSHWVGAVVGYMTGTISDCTVTNSTITGFNVNDNANGDKVGGIVGMLNEHSYINNNTVSDCTISGNRDIGGIAGTVSMSTMEMKNNKVTNTVITYSTAKDYGSAGKIVSGRTGYVANDTNTVADVIVGQVGDNGLIADPANARTYLITSADDLIAFNSYVATGVAGEGKAVTAKLMADIDMAGKDWPAMHGHWVNFDGQGYTISNLTPTANSVGKNGFVGYLGAGNISNLTLKNVNVVGAQAGIFAGQNEGGSITNCKIEGTNTVVWKQNTGDYQEVWGGIGAVLGVNNCNANINAEIKSGAVVTLNKTELVTQCTAIDNYVGYLSAYTGTVTNNGTVNVVKEMEANDTASLEQAIADGASTITLAAGEYKMPSVSSAKEFSITGTKDTVIDVTMGAYMDSSKVSFEGITLKVGTGYANGNGSDYAALYTPNVTYTDCTFDGPFRVGRDGATFINCTFTNLGNDYVWAYGNDVTFQNCTFESDGKALLLYSDGGEEVSKVVVKDCVFNATMGAKAGAIANQNCAAIEIQNYGNGADLTTSGNTIDSDFSGEWRIKAYHQGRPAVIVNGTEYTSIALDGKLMTIDSSNNVTVIG